MNNIKEFENLKNPEWRLNNLYKIKTKQGKTIRFKPNFIQQKINNINENRYTILKNRQCGVSTNELLKAFDFAAWNKNATACIMAHEADSIKKLFDIVRFAHKNIPERIRPILDRGGGSKYEMRFPKENSKIYVDLESRGETIHWLHVSEAAFIQEKEKFDATCQSVPIGNHVSIETTPNGMNWFYDLWVDKDFPSKKLFFPWYIHDEYKIQTDVYFELSEEEERFCSKVKQNYNIDITHEQILFRRNKQAELKGLFLQEYPEDDIGCFLSSGNPFFDLNVVKNRLESIPQPIEKTETTKIFEHANSGLNYVCGADTAEGVGGDNSTASIRCIETQKQVATMLCNLKPSDFAKALIEFCRPYNHRGAMPLLAVERNNHGHAVLLTLENEGYNNLYYFTDERVGWLSNSISKPIMLNGMKDLLDSNPSSFNDKITLQECLTFVNEKGKLGAISGKHDDTIIADAISIQMMIRGKIPKLPDEKIDIKPIACSIDTEDNW